MPPMLLSNMPRMCILYCKNMSSTLYWPLVRNRVRIFGLALCSIDEIASSIHRRVSILNPSILNESPQPLRECMIMKASLAGSNDTLCFWPHAWTLDWQCCNSLRIRSCSTRRSNLRNTLRSSANAFPLNGATMAEIKSLKNAFHNGGPSTVP